MTTPDLHAQPTGGSWAPLSGLVRPPGATNAAPASPSGSDVAPEPQMPAHTCGTPPSQSCCACMDELAPADDPFDVGPAEPEYVATARPGDTVILRVPTAVDLKWVNVQVAVMRELNPEVTFLVLADDCSATVVPSDLHASIRLTLGDVDSQWNDATGDGPASPDYYLDRLASGVLAAVIEHYAKESS